MQLNNLLTKPKHDSGAWYTVIDPANGKETNFRILVSGMDSKIYRTENRALASEWLPVRSLIQTWSRQKSLQNWCANGMDWLTMTVKTLRLRRRRQNHCCLTARFCVIRLTDLWAIAQILCEVGRRALRLCEALFLVVRIWQRLKSQPAIR